MDWQLDAGFNGTAALRDTGDDKLIVMFRYEAVENKVASDKAGYPVFDDKEFVTISASGAKYPAYEGPVTERHKARFKDRYEAWKRTGEQARNGLPLEQWSYLTKARCAELKASGIHTVEELANVPDSLTSSIGLYGSQTREVARKFLESARDTAIIPQLVREKDELRADLAVAQQQVAALRSQVDQLLKASGAPASPAAPAVDQTAIAAMVASAVKAALQDTPKGVKKKNE